MARIKPFLSHTEQVELLISRGMHISRVNTQIVCIFRACRVGLVSCPAFADV